MPIGNIDFLNYFSCTFCTFFICSAHANYRRSSNWWRFCDCWRAVTSSKPQATTSKCRNPPCAEYCRKCAMQLSNTSIASCICRAIRLNAWRKHLLLQWLPACNDALVPVKCCFIRHFAGDIAGQNQAQQKICFRHSEIFPARLLQSIIFFIFNFFSILAVWALCPMEHCSLYPLFTIWNEKLTKNKIETKTSKNRKLFHFQK